MNIHQFAQILSPENLRAQGNEVGAKVGVRNECHMEIGEEKVQHRAEDESDVPLHL